MEFNLSEQEVKEIFPKVEAEAKKSIVFDELYYLFSREYNNNGKTIYHVFAAFNPVLEKYQKVTYCPTDHFIEFSLHLLTTK